MSAHALVDPIDAKWACGRRWSLSSKGYARSHRDGRVDYMHRLIAERAGHVVVGREVHHGNENRLDNRRENLTPETPSAHRQAHLPSGRGVTFHKQSGRWLAYNGRGKNRRYLGLHKTEEAAEAAVAEARCSYR